MSTKLLGGLVVLAGIIAAGPALAVPFCADSGVSPGVHISGSIVFGDTTSDRERDMRFHLMNLRRNGVDAVSVETWNGCLRAYVRTASGQEMEFYDPNTYQRVY